MVELLITGNVHTVLEGHVEEKNLIPLSLSKLSYALGAIAFENKEGLQVGEGLVFENHAHAYVSSEKWTSKSQILTPFIMGIERKPQNFHLIKEPSTLADLYGKLLKVYSAGFVVIGSVHFSQIEVAYLKRNPFYGENINTLKEKYWQAQNFPQINAQVVGVVLPFLEPRAFYDNPNEAQKSPFYSHTHALIADGARHLLTHSLLEHADLWIEEVQII